MRAIISKYKLTRVFRIFAFVIVQSVAVVVLSPCSLPLFDERSRAHVHLCAATARPLGSREEIGPEHLTRHLCLVVLVRETKLISNKSMALFKVAGA